MFGKGNFSIHLLLSLFSRVSMISTNLTWTVHDSTILCKVTLHTPLETWFWFQWTLTIPYDQGWWEHWFKLYLRWFHCKNLDLYFSTDFKRVLWKNKIIRQMIAFYYIFGFFGTFYDGWSHFCGIKIQFLT